MPRPSPSSWRRFEVSSGTNKTERPASIQERQVLPALWASSCPWERQPVPRRARTRGRSPPRCTRVRRSTRSLGAALARIRRRVSRLEGSTTDAGSHDRHEGNRALLDSRVHSPRARRNPGPSDEWFHRVAQAREKAECFESRVAGLELQARMCGAVARCTSGCSRYP
jgi:hypothetical protein